MTLWQKEYTPDNLIQQFATGNDYLLDQQLVHYDCLGSIAHAAMLAKIGILSETEYRQLHAQLVEIITKAAKSDFFITPADEDVHTAVEHYLVKTLDQLGKKIHTARSRNDQIILDMRLFMRDQLLIIVDCTLLLCKTLSDFAKQHGDIPYAGRTHFQPAMPSSLGLWAGALCESLLDTVLYAQTIFKLINQNPLGSAAGYGVNIPIDREYTTTLLGFDTVQKNVLYVANSRVKIEALFMHTLTEIMNDLNKLATDIIMFSMPEFGYLTLPPELCLGSSIMPQKHNPDFLELIRAKSSTVQSYHFQLLNINNNLPSGYHRDFQETKESVMKASNITTQSLTVINHGLKKIGVNKNACLASCTPEIFAADYANQSAQNGTAFRDAYKQISTHLTTLQKMDPVQAIKNKKHIGAPGNLGLEKNNDIIKQYQQWVDEQMKKIEQSFKNLVG